MGCESTKEKIESKMLYLKLERASIREERKNILKELEKITGFEWKRNEIPDYMNINEKIRIENEILGSKIPYVDEKEYYEYHIAKRNKKKFKQYMKKNKKNKNNNNNNNNNNNDNSKNNIEEMKNQSENEQEIVIKEIDVENELKKRLNEYNINDNNIQIKAIDIINKKHKKQLNYNDDNFYNDLNYIMNTINKNNENDENNTIIEEINEENNNNEVLKINVLKNNKNKNEKEIMRNKKKIPSWRDITYK